MLWILVRWGRSPHVLYVCNLPSTFWQLRTSSTFHQMLRSKSFKHISHIFTLCYDCFMSLPQENVTGNFGLHFHWSISRAPGDSHSCNTSAMKDVISTCISKGGQSSGPMPSWTNEPFASSARASNDIGRLGIEWTQRSLFFCQLIQPRLQNFEWDQGLNLRIIPRMVNPTCIYTWRP